jgi:two-component system NtrC family sensor kinase
VNPTVTVEQPLIDFRPALLVVDDEHFICSAIERIFERQGIKVHKAYNALEGLERLANVDVQVVISDFQMPGHDGAWFLSQVRLAAPRVQRVLLTAGYKANVDDLQRSINEGGVHRFLTKPWSNEHLVRTVQECMDQWRILAERDHLVGALAKRRTGCWRARSRRGRGTSPGPAGSGAARSTPSPIRSRWSTPSCGWCGRTWPRRRRRTSRSGRSWAQRCHEALFGRESACEGCPLAASPGGVAGANVEIVDERNGRTWKVTTWPLAEAGESTDAGDKTSPSATTRT